MRKKIIKIIITFILLTAIIPIQVLGLSFVEVIPPIYESYTPCLFLDNAIFVSKDGKSGIVDIMTGKEIVPPNYHEIYEYGMYLEGYEGFDGYLGVMLDKKIGLFDIISGKEVVPPKFEYVSTPNEGLVIVCDGKIGALDIITGKEIIPLKYDNSGPWFSDGVLNVELNGKWGYIDKAGNEVIPFIYEDAKSQYDGVAPVKLNGKWMLIDKTGKEILSLNYDEVDNFSEGIAKVKLNGKYGYIDTTGKELVAPKYDYAFMFLDGLGKVMKNGVWGEKGYDGYLTYYGYVDKTGKEIVTPNKYISIEEFKNDTAIVCTDNGNYGLIDRTGKEIIQSKYLQIRELKDDLVEVLVSGEDFLDRRFGVLDKTGKEIIPPIYRYINYNEGLFVAGKEDRIKSVLLDKNGNLIRTFDYNWVSEFHDGMAKIVENQKYGYIDINGKKIIPAKYWEATNFQNGIAIVKLNQECDIIDKTGKIIKKIPYTGTVDFSENIIGLISSSNWKYAFAMLNPSFSQSASSKAANPTSSKILINGKEAKFDAYNIEGSNYFKLRDLAYSLKDTTKQFDVGYDANFEAVTISTAQPYAIQGGEMAAGDGKVKTTDISTNTFYINGNRVQINAYKIAGSNFIKLRDVMKLLNVGVTYNASTGIIEINTNIDYMD